MIKLHNVKLSKEYFNDVACGDKKFEVRLNDRDYKINDRLILNEVILENNLPVYTGRSINTTITYILDNNNYLKDGYVILGIDVDNIILNS